MMDTSNRFNKRHKPVTGQFKDVSRFTRFISQMDNSDKKLDPLERKLKWLVLLAVLFLLYVASFFLPVPEFIHDRLKPEATVLGEDTALRKRSFAPAHKSLTFEMPVDSFENLLKQRIDENHPEKK